MHVTEPQNGENTVLGDTVYWEDNLLTEAYMFGRGLGSTKPATELADCELVVLDFGKLLELLDERGVIDEENEREVLHISDLGEAFSPDEIADELGPVIQEVTVQEAYELDAIFAYNKDSQKLVWLYPDGYVTETRMKDLLGGNRTTLEKHRQFKEGLDLFDKIFKE